MTLELSEQEREFLLEMLQAEHSTLLDEVLHTDAYEYRELLKQKVELLKQLKSRIEASRSDSQTI